jgi:hypothetical protein
MRAFRKREVIEPCLELTKFIIKAAEAIYDIIFAKCWTILAFRKLFCYNNYSWSCFRSDWKNMGKNLRLVNTTANCLKSY